MIELEFYPTEIAGDSIEINDFQLDTFTYTFDIEQHKYQNTEHYKIILPEEDWNSVENNITWDSRGVADYATLLKEDGNDLFRGLIQKEDVKTNHKTNMSSIITYSFLKLFDIHNDIGLIAADYDGRTLPFLFETFATEILSANNCYSYIDIADSMPHIKSISLNDYESFKQFDWEEMEDKSRDKLPEHPTEDETWEYKDTGYMGYFFSEGDVAKLVVYANTVGKDEIHEKSCYSVEYKYFYIVNKTFLIEADEGNYASEVLDSIEKSAYFKGLEDVLNNFGATDEYGQDITYEDIGPNDTSITLNGTNWISYEMPFNYNEWDYQNLLGYLTYDAWGLWLDYFSSGEIEIAISGELIPDNFVGGIPKEDYRDYNIWDTLRDALRILDLKLDIDNTTAPPTVITKDMNEATQNTPLSSSDFIEKNTSYTKIEYSDKMDILGDGSYLLDKLNGISDFKKQISLKIISDDYDLDLGEGVTIDGEDYIITSTERDIWGHTKDIEVLEL